MLPHHRAILLLPLLLLLLAIPGRAQELEVEATPFSVVIDFGLLQNGAAEPPSSLPIWLASVSMLRDEPGTLPLLPALPEPVPDPTPIADADLSNSSSAFSVASSQPQPPSHTTYRLRLRSLPGFTGPDDHLLLRLYFDDAPDKAPLVTGWSETGTQYYRSAPLGSGLTLPNTATLRIPTAGIDYLDITVPGDGRTIRQAFLSSLQKTTADTALDFSTHTDTAPLHDPFGNTATHSEPHGGDGDGNGDGNSDGAPDRLLFGRIHAQLDPVEILITPAGTQQPTAYDIEFTLESSPLLAAISFEILNAEPSTPLATSINSRATGPLAIRFPDLSDPAYVGKARPFSSIAFHYTSWAPCQKILPGRLLQPGQNRFTLELPPGSAPVAIRRVEIQLKHHWKKLDYTLLPD